MNIRSLQHRTAARSAALFALLSIAGCASTRVDTQWSDPQFAGSSLQGAKVLVVCDASDMAVRRRCQERLAGEVTALGASAVQGPEIANPSPGRQMAAQHLLPAAREAGATAVFSASVIPDAMSIHPEPSVGFGIGGFGGGHVGGGVGISMPMGGGERQTGHAANAMVTDVASGRLMWSVRASTPPSSDIGGQVDELVKAVAVQAQKAGLF